MKANKAEVQGLYKTLLKVLPDEDSARAFTKAVLDNRLAIYEVKHYTHIGGTKWRDVFKHKTLGTWLD